MAGYIELALSVEQSENTWSVSGIQRRDPSALLCLLYILAERLGKYLELPAYLNVVVCRVEKIGSTVRNKVVMIKVWEEWVVAESTVRGIDESNLSMLLI